MILLSNARALILDVLESNLSINVYEDVSELGSGQGAILQIENVTNFESRNIDNLASNTTTVTASLICYSFENRAECDSIVDDVLTKFDGHYTTDIQLIAVTAIDNLVYEKDVGFYGAVVSFQFVFGA